MNEVSVTTRARPLLSTSTRPSAAADGSVIGSVQAMPDELHAKVRIAEAAVSTMRTTLIG